MTLLCGNKTIKWPYIHEQPHLRGLEAKTGLNFKSATTITYLSMHIALYGMDPVCCLKRVRLGWTTVYQGQSIYAHLCPQLPELQGVLAHTPQSNTGWLCLLPVVARPDLHSRGWKERSRSPDTQTHSKTHCFCVLSIVAGHSQKSLAGVKTVFVPRASSYTVCNYGIVISTIHNILLSMCKIQWSSVSCCDKPIQLIH